MTRLSASLTTTKKLTNDGSQLTNELKHDVEVDYDDPESPTPAVQPESISFTTVADLRHATSSTTDAKLTTGGELIRDRSLHRP